MCARSSKFSLFDPAKEMAYIQMSRAEKSKGKAAVDLIGSQVLRPCLRLLPLHCCAHACPAGLNSVPTACASSCCCWLPILCSPRYCGRKHDTNLTDS